MYRNLLKREMEKVARGEDPMITIRSEADDRAIDLPLEVGKDMFNDGFASLVRRHMSNFSPIVEDILEVFARDKAVRTAGTATPVTASSGD
jgi:5,5'-dehydrodivanillate O-demethylase